MGRRQRGPSEAKAGKKPAASKLATSKPAASRVQSQTAQAGGCNAAPRGDGLEGPGAEDASQVSLPPPLPDGEDLLRPIDDLAAVRECYERYGVVGVTGVLSGAECQALLTEGIEPFLPAGCRMDSVETFGLADASVNRFGVIGKSALFNPAVLAARVHPNVAAAYSSVYGRGDVYAGHDRAAWMRPAAVDPAWVTPFTWPGLHLDISLRGYFEGNRSEVDSFLASIDYSFGNFAAENNAKHASMGRTVQGVLSLYDNNEEDGGFQCVPGMFGPPLRRWAQLHGGLPEPEVNGKYVLKGYGPDAQLGKLAVRLPCPAGTLILFDATLPHGTRPSASCRPRAVLFLRYLSSDELPAEAWESRNAALRRAAAEAGFEPDERQARYLYGVPRAASEDDGNEHEGRTEAEPPRDGAPAALEAEPPRDCTLAALEA